MMKKIKINNYYALEQLKEENEFIIDISETPLKEKKSIIFFLLGLTFINGCLKKVSADNYKVIIKNN